MTRIANIAAFLGGIGTCAGVFVAYMQFTTDRQGTSSLQEIAASVTALVEEISETDLEVTEGGLEQLDDAIKQLSAQIAGAADETGNGIIGSASIARVLSGVFQLSFDETVLLEGSADVDVPFVVYSVFSGGNVRIRLDNQTMVLEPGQYTNITIGEDQCRLLYAHPEDEMTEVIFRFTCS